MSDLSVQAAPEPARRTVGETVAGWQRRAPVLQVVALIALFTYGAIDIAGFSDWLNIKSMLVLAALLALAALGQTLVLIVGGIDFSVPGFILLGAVVTTELFGTNGWPPLPAILLAVLIAASMGGLAGFICHTFRIQPLIVTLGMGGLAAGGVLAWTDGEINSEVPTFLTTLTSTAETTFGLDVPPLVVITVLLGIVVGVILQRTKVGRRFYATGANPRAAAIIRIDTRKMWVGVFALSAMCSALVGILLAGFSGVDPAVGDPYLFQGLTAVIVGGTTIMGARGDYTHTMVGALILVVMTTIFVGKNIDAATQQIIFGALILVVVALYGRGRRLRDRV